MADRFTQYLIGLPDASFFALIRNYLGPFKTPFNKHELIHHLREFLSRSETVERVELLLDTLDRRVLTAVEVLGRPDFARLHRFLGDEVGEVALRERLFNLLDRLVLLRDEQSDRFELNPVFAETFHAHVIDPALVVHWEAHDAAGSGTEGAGPGATAGANAGGTAPRPWFTIGFAAALRAYLLRVETVFTNTGALRKRVQGELNELFGSAMERRPERLTIALAALETLGLIERVDERIVVMDDAWHELTHVPAGWIQALLWAGSMTTTVERAFELAELIRYFVLHPIFGRSIRAAHVARALVLAGGGDSLTDSGTAEGLRRLDVLVTGAEADWVLGNMHARALLTDGEPSGGVGAVTVHAAMEITIDPTAALETALTVGSVARLARYDTVAHYEITEASVADAGSLGIEGPVVDTLERLSGRRIPQNVAFLVRRWEDRAGALRVVRGTVVFAREEEAALLRAATDFAALVAEEPVPGVFVLANDDSRALERVLGRVGVGTPTAVAQGLSRGAGLVPEYRRLFDRFQQPLLVATTLDRVLRDEPRRDAGRAAEQTGPREDGAREHGAREHGAHEHGAHEHGAREHGAHEDGAREDRGQRPTPRREALRQSALDVLARAELSEEERREWELRIQNGLVLFPEQIRSGQFMQAATEARGLDYLGKLRVIEQAMGDGQILEIVTRSASGAPDRMLARPLELVQSGSDVVLRATVVEDQRIVRVRVRKISLVRRLRGTLLQR